MIKYLIFDAETTGLNIITDTPFLLPYALVDENLDIISKHMFDPMVVNIQRALFIQHLKAAPTLVGHNLKYDIHMCMNAGIDPMIFESKNMIDTAVLARLAISHDIQKDKTFSIALKKLGTRYLQINASDEERILKAELSSLTMAHKAEMKDYFIKFYHWYLCTVHFSINITSII